jgi:hypothetical protein
VVDRQRSSPRVLLSPETLAAAELVYNAAPILSQRDGDRLDKHRETSPNIQVVRTSVQLTA